MEILVYVPEGARAGPFDAKLDARTAILDNTDGIRVVTACCWRAALHGMGTTVNNTIAQVTMKATECVMIFVQVKFPVVQPEDRR